MESDTEGCEIDTSIRHKIFNFPLLVKDKRKFPLCEKERTKANIRWVKSTKGKGIFRLWTESGWRHALVGAEMGKVFLTVYLEINFPYWQLEDQCEVSIWNLTSYWQLEDQWEGSI